MFLHIKENDEGEFVGGRIYNFYNCKFYYSKIVPLENGKIKFVGALDSYYFFHANYIWQKLDKKEAQKYQQYRKSKAFLLKTAKDTENAR